ncbi:response regulator transcription factor [Leucobacter insecticola]|uniref:Response regulator transcription factor n=1 Tax=Leucobacter insecticola TaxID=2714934 RepID=A0A6G8FKW7_9MICO|nr:LuxR C-terminal-related transcriptional regulator [Leucobacter insecticola]QIM17015.1 response regulator transcription factor [Leucobacter insecticola]
MKQDTLTPEQSSLDAAVRAFAQATKFDITFGGFEHRGVATVASLHGNQTQSLKGLEVAVGRGLGGRAMSESRPRLTADYARSSKITHDYDAQVLGEGIRMLFAVPVIVDGCVRAVVYGGSRTSSAPGNALLDAASNVTRAFIRDIRINDEVTRRLAEIPNRLVEQPTMPAATLEELRESYAELRGISAGVSDPALRAKLLALESRLKRLSGGSGSDEIVHESNVNLSPRERDVLAHVALGSSNTEIGQVLGLTESTVKSYLKTASTKLGCSGRHAAVSAARKAGLLP